MSCAGSRGRSAHLRAVSDFRDEANDFSCKSLPVLDFSPMRIIVPASPPLPALLLLALSCSISPCDGLNIHLDWSRPIGQSSTAATVEVDVMPFLARQPATDPYIRDHHYGGSFEAYQTALAHMNASYVRFAPWCPNPRLVVPELTPPSCTATKPAANWNSTFFDQLMKDFMETVCGPDAAKGECQGRMSVIQQLSTMPSWMYHGGMSLKDVPANPYIPTPGGHKQYEQGRSLVDPSCETMAQHIGRVVGWYTAGGFHDDCGHWHASGLKYQWWGLSILNEDEHGIKPEGGVAYTTCFDAVRKQLEGINPTLRLVGPEISGSGSYPSSQFDYLAYFMNKSHHVASVEPLLASYHVGLKGDNSSAEGFFTQWDSVLSGFVPQADKLLAGNSGNGNDGSSSSTGGGGQRLLLNEFVNSVQDWCEEQEEEEEEGLGSGGKGSSGGRWGCPDWQKPSTDGGDPDLTHGKGVKINRKTWSWNAAAGVFAYAFGTLAERDYLLVGQDQLVAGTFPDNEPAVAMLDWVTGEANAKYYVTQLLASTIGAAVEKTLYGYNVTSSTGGAGIADALDSASSSSSSTVYVLPFRFGAGTDSGAGGQKGVLLVNKKAASVTITLVGLSSGDATAGGTGGGAAVATVVEVAPEFVGGPGFQPPVKRAVSVEGELTLGPFAVAVVLE